ncbi:ATP-dependent DNA helicase RecG [bacterium]|nr:ATP-dependent DNA helicase RecG [bacterium]
MELKKISGVGPKVYNILLEKGITDVKSLLYTFPSKYSIYKLTGFLYEGTMNARATVIDEPQMRKLSKNTIITFNTIIDDLSYKVSVFNMVYLSKTLHIGSEIVIIGEYNKDYKEINASKIVNLKDFKEGIFPEYNIEGIANANFNKIVNNAIEYYEKKDELIPSSYYQKYGYKTGKELLKDIHNPKSEEDIKNSINALKYYELLSFSIKLELMRLKQTELKKEPKKYDLEKIKSFIYLGIHFELTDDQKKAVNDICKYLSSNIPMNMLLEGDVGSGKTIIALISAYAVKTASYQSLIMVPTEALAAQHYKTFTSYLSDFDTKVALLTSSTKIKERREILESLKKGDIDIIIGTHSLISDEVVFKNLGFVVCDEQHKFGVEQRKKIREKGNNPDCLYMTATPIPRTLALTFFNDMVLEQIRTIPSSRKSVKTFAHTYKDYLKVLDFVKSEISDGRQAYFVASCIEDDQESSYVSVIKMRDDLLKYYGNDIRIGLLHGKLTQEEKNKVLNDFMEGGIDILASTTVIEVGIDNPNASVMVIIDANKFGLSTLHQLRGRVGRGSFEGYSFLMVDNKESLERIKILEETQDGFLISEQDLRDRGPGDFLGTEQSGMLKFDYANIFRDVNILNNAKKDAKELINIENIKEFYDKKLISDNFD